MARVYLAESLASGLLRKLVVLKVLNQDLASDREMRDAFLREAEISARLNHPSIVNVYEVFEQGNTPVMVMQHLDGMALSEVLSHLQGKIPLKLHLNILCQVLDALHYFHELTGPDGESLECVHRDVSPHNVMVLHEGGVKVVDFGVAKVRAQTESHTRTGIIKGKVAYMPPEQLLACATVDRRADIYSVGVMLWEAAAGRRMWRGMDASTRMRAIMLGDIPSIREAAPGVSDTLAKVIERALSHTPDGRFATAQEMQIELEQVTLTEGGYSLPREIAEFMRVNFGDARREKQRVIEKAVGDRDYSLADATWSSSELPAGLTERSGVKAAYSAELDPSVIIERERPRRPILIGALAAVLCLVAGAVMMSRSEHAPADTAATADGSTATVALRVTSQPEGADVYMDGVKLGVTPLFQTRPASSAQATIELRAPGHLTQSKVVSLQQDLTVDVAMQEEVQKDARARDVAASPASSTEDAPSAASQLEEQERRQATARRRQPPRRAEPPSGRASENVSAPAVAPAASKANAAHDNCDPPYRLDPGGVKVFKPQCF